MGLESASFIQDLGKSIETDQRDFEKLTNEYDSTGFKLSHGERKLIELRIHLLGNRLIVNLEQYKTLIKTDLELAAIGIKKKLHNITVVSLGEDYGLMSQLDDDISRLQPPPVDPDDLEPGSSVDGAFQSGVIQSILHKKK